jgi:lambda family phage portal protein
MKIFGLEVKRNLIPAIIKRGFSAAKINRLTNDWAYAIINTNDDIKNNLQILKGRSRELAKNNSLFRKYLSMREKNIVGANGITLQMKVKEASGNLDKGANSIIEKAFYDWQSAKHCDVAGKLTWIKFQRLWSRTLAIDGEVVVRIWKGRGKYGFQLQMIDSFALDIQYNDINRNIIMGVELDSFGKPIAYHFKASKWESTYSTDNQRQRIPANEIIHKFVVEFPGQVRGIPKPASSILAINMLNGYSEAELVAARASACKGGFYEAGENYVGDDEVDGQIIEETSPGMARLLPKGLTWKEHNPTHPNGNYEGFTRAQMREVAGGLDVSYNSLSSDLTSVNFSSMRSGALEERDGWKLEQSDMIEDLCEPVFEGWLDMFLLSGVSNLPYSKLEKFHADNWIPRAFQWVDPRADAEANILLMEKGLKAPQEIVAEQGQELEDVYMRIAKAKEMQLKYKLDFPEVKAGLFPPPVDKKPSIEKDKLDENT